MIFRNEASLDLNQSLMDSEFGITMVRLHRWCMARSIFELLLNLNFGNGAFRETGLVFGDVVVSPREFDFCIGFE